MSNELKEHLDILRERILTPDFLEGRGLSNEVNIRIFSYDAKDEMVVRNFLDHLKADQTLKCRILECDLYRVFIDICSELDILDSIPEMEEADGSDYLLEQLHSTVGEAEFIEKMLETTGQTETGDVVLLSGIGDVFPFMRVHKILEAMQPYFPDVPVLVMYPGTFDGSSLKLFDKLTPNPYYRAFNVL